MGAGRIRLEREVLRAGSSVVAREKESRELESVCTKALLLLASHAFENAVEIALGGLPSHHKCSSGHSLRTALLTLRILFVPPSIFQASTEVPNSQRCHSLTSEDSRLRLKALSLRLLLIAHYSFLKQLLSY